MRFPSKAARMALSGALSVGIVVATWTAPSKAEERFTFDLQPVSLMYGPRGDRTEIWVMAFTYGYRFNSLFPYVRGGVGCFTLQARGGVAWMPGDLEESGPIFRLEAQPQILFNPCWEHLLVGNAAAGWRWPLERGDPGYPGAAFYLMPAFIGGGAFLH